MCMSAMPENEHEPHTDHEAPRGPERPSAMHLGRSVTGRGGNKSGKQQDRESFTAAEMQEESMGTLIDRGRREQRSVTAGSRMSEVTS